MREHQARNSAWPSRTPKMVPGFHGDCVRLVTLCRSHRGPQPSNRSPHLHPLRSKHRDGANSEAAQRFVEKHEHVQAYFAGTSRSGNNHGLSISRGRRVSRPRSMPAIFSTQGYNAGAGTALPNRNKALRLSKIAPLRSSHKSDAELAVDRKVAGARSTVVARERIASPKESSRGVMWFFL